MQTASPEIAVEMYIPPDPKSNTVVAVETGLDVAVHFQICNTLLAYPSPGSMAMTIIIGAGCIATRMSGELQVQGRDAPYPVLFNNFARNLGAPLMVNGAALAIATVPKAIESGVDVALTSDIYQPVTASETAILFTFAGGNFARGLARGISPGFKQAALDTVGTAAGASGIMVSVPDSYLVTKGLLLSSVLVEAARASRLIRIPAGSAEAVMASGTCLNAFQAFASGDTKMGWFNVFGTAALTSLGMLKNSHGVLRFLTGKGPRKAIPFNQDLAAE